MARLFFVLYSLLISTYILSLDGHFIIEQNKTDKDWSILDKFNNSFDKNNIASSELLLIGEKFGIKLRQSDFSLDLVRFTEPKDVRLKAKSHFSELYFFLDSDSAISVSFKNQKADDQFIKCYSFSTFIIGSCEDASITITNSDEKYNILKNDIMKIDGKNEEFRFSYTSNQYNNFSDQIIVYAGISKNSFDWITPIEEIKSGFLFNLTIEGQKLGDLIQRELSRLPQRDSFYIYKVGITSKKDFQLNSFIDFFYELDIVALSSDKYNEINTFQNNNVRFKSGLNMNFNQLDLSFYGILYKNNILGYEDIAFNQRSEHHFDKKFGNLGLKLQYNF
tara:strand:+ start:327 stop:1331 length:1005 start_codon:yes stop_codon:yes gene_type:complete